jgi:hypothetical protein
MEKIAANVFLVSEDQFVAASTMRMTEKEKVIAKRLYYTGIEYITRKDTPSITEFQSMAETVSGMVEQLISIGTAPSCCVKFLTTYRTFVLAYLAEWVDLKIGGLAS